MNCSVPGFPVLYCLPKFAQTHIHWIGDAIQPSHPVAPVSFHTQSFPASVFSNELGLHIRWFKAYLIIKLLSFSPTFMERFPGLPEDFVFNDIPSCNSIYFAVWRHCPPNSSLSFMPFKILWFFSLAAVFFHLDLTPSPTMILCFYYLLNKFSLFKIIHVSPVYLLWYILRLCCFCCCCYKSLQSCLTLCDPIDGSPPGSPVLGFSRQEYWSGLPFPSPMHESEKSKWNRSVVFNS